MVIQATVISFSAIYMSMAVSDLSCFGCGIKINKRYHGGIIVR